MESSASDASTVDSDEFNDGHRTSSIDGGNQFRGPRSAWSYPLDLSVPPSPLTITTVNQTHDLLKLRDDDTRGKTPADQQSSEEWLKKHSIESLGLTVTHLLEKGIVASGKSPETGSTAKYLQFETDVVNQFEQRVHQAQEDYNRRLRWILQGSKRTFGVVKGKCLAVLVDVSNTNIGFGRLTDFQNALHSLIDEQLNVKDSVFLVAVGVNAIPLWKCPRDVNYRTLKELKRWATGLVNIEPQTGCNLLQALKLVLSLKDIDSVHIILGSTPDQSAEVLCDYVQQCLVARSLPLQTVSYECSNHFTNVTLRNMAEVTKGRLHIYNSADLRQIYAGTDIQTILTEMTTAQDVLKKIKEMRQGMMGDALVSIMDEISAEVSKLPTSRFLPRPPNHTGMLKIQEPKFHPKTSVEWLQQHGLKAKKLSLYQVLAPNAFDPIKDFVPIINKDVKSQNYERAMVQFEWFDKTIKNLHVDPTLLYHYQKKLGAAVSLFEKRIDWLSLDGRALFGTISEKRIVLIIDICEANTNYLIHIQHSVRILLEQQLANKLSFNVVAFGSKVHLWRPTMVAPTEKNLQSAWRWILGLECEGGRNFLAAFRQSLENEEDRKNTAVQGLYLLTSGVPDQIQDVACAYVNEAATASCIRLHTIVFSIDDYDAAGRRLGRYANITQTADYLRQLAHAGYGRFHWIRETGIIESDDIKILVNEMEKAVGFNEKCVMLIDGLKKKCDDTRYSKKQQTSTALMPRPPPPPTRKPASLLPPKDTALSKSRKGIPDAKETSATKTNAWRPASAIHKNLIPGTPSHSDNQTYDTSTGRRLSSRPSSASSKNSKTVKEFFYTGDSKQAVGTIYKEYPDILKKRPKVRKTIKSAMIPEKEEVTSTKNWLKKYGIKKLKLDLNRLVSGPDCVHSKKHVKTLKKTVQAQYCKIFPNVPVKGTMRHLQYQPHELIEYEENLEFVLNRYVKRLEWLLSGSRRMFGCFTEKKIALLIDTSGSMDPYLQELKNELAALIWDQLEKERIFFNLVRFSGSLEKWRESVVQASEANCHHAVKWVSTFVANGNTCTLEALTTAFEDEDCDAVYLLTDGKPDTSCSMVLKEVAELNDQSSKKRPINTISFNCTDITANTFLKQLAMQTGGRYHRYQDNFDADKFIHALQALDVSDNLQEEHMQVPQFEGDDLRRLMGEIVLTRSLLSQSRQYRRIVDSQNKSQQGSDDIVINAHTKSRPRKMRHTSTT